MSNILIACEQSQVVCAAFRHIGLNAFSNDLLDCYGGHPEWHIKGDAAQVIKGGCWNTQSGAQLFIEKWDLIIAHPPCTMITHAGAVQLSNGNHTIAQVKEAAIFFMQMLNAPCERVAIENPAPLKIAQLPPYDQIIQPYNFGHKYSKRVCLWLKGLPPLLPMMGYYTQHIPWIGHCAGNSRRRSRSFEGIAEAMANQWGSLL